jgi:hypothetical protein
MRLTSILVFALAALACACSRNVGAGGALPLTPLHPATSIRRPQIPPLPPFQLSARVLLGAKSVPIPLPSGFGGTLSPAGIFAGTTPASLLASSSNPAPTMAPNAAPLFYVTIAAGTNVQLGAGTTFAFSLPSAYVVKGARYYVASYDPGNPAAGWTQGYAGPAKIAANALTITTHAPLFLAAGVAYDFALFATYGRPAPPSLQQFTMIGRMVQRYAYAYPTASPKPPIRMAGIVTESFLVGKAKLPPAIGRGTATKVHVTESDAGALQTTVKTTDAYALGTGGFETLLGTVSYEFAPWATTYDQTTTTVYPAPLEVAPSPAAAGKTWTNSPAATVVQAFSGGQSYQRTIAADGSYVEKGTIPLSYGTPQPVCITEFPNGQGVYGQGFHAGQAAFVFAAPTSSPSVIAVSTEAPDPTVSPCAASRPQPSYTTVPAWFPTPPPGGSPLYAETDASTNATAPKTCGLLAGKPALLVTRSVWRLDTIVGYSERILDRSYTGASGVGCLDMRDDINVYYDWNGDVEPRPYLTFGGAPIATVTTTEHLTGFSAASGSLLVPPAVAQAAQAHFTARIDRLRAKLLSRGGLR